VYVILHANRTRHVGDVSADVSGDRTDELLEALRGQVQDLREQLQAERQGHAEARRLLMAALERIPPQLEASPEAPQSPEPGEQDSDRGNAPQQPQTAPQRPWWRFWR
jgi:hypothetical protein